MLKGSSNGELEGVNEFQIQQMGPGLSVNLICSSGILVFIGKERGHVAV